MKSADAAKWGKLGAPGWRGFQERSRLATEEGIHLERREDGRIPAEGEPVIVPEILFWPAREEKVRQTVGIQGEPRSPQGRPQSGFTAPFPSPIRL